MVNPSTAEVHEYNLSHVTLIENPYRFLPDLHLLSICDHLSICARSQIIMAATTECFIFRNVIRYSLEEDYASFAYFLTLRIEAVSYPETSVNFFQTTDAALHPRR
jgi:hypothetical protein